MTLLWFRRLLNWSRYTAISLVTAIIVVALVDGINSLNLPNLSPWHQIKLKHQFDRYSQVNSFDQYLQLEAQLFEELETRLISVYQPTDDAELNRYVRESISSPNRFAQDYNRSFELVPSQPIGAVVLLHGLTDSPYSLRHLGHQLHRLGYYVLALRLPGHGTIPASLKRARWEDWAAAADLAIDHASKQIDAQLPLVLAGYSMGGALALNKVADDLLEKGETRVDQLLLFSPAVGVSAVAWLANFHRLISGIPFFQKASWASVVPEFDPFKYQSFPKNAAWQVRRITRQLDRKIGQLFESGQTADFPSVLTAMSVVDATVSVQSVVDLLYRRLPETRHDLLLFDINHHHRSEGYLKPGLEQRVDALFTKNSHSAYQRHVVSNYYTDSNNVEVITSLPGTDVYRADTGLQWPHHLFSLTHIAITFPSHDPIYGSEFHPDVISLGALELRGETGILQIRDSQIMRLRYNPFYAYLAQHIEQFINATPLPAPTPAAAATQR